nr:Gag-Pol polyprotein [Tanacetum cinerariifolium]
MGGLLLRLRISRELVVEVVRDRRELVVEVGGKNEIKMNSVSNGVTGMKGFMGCTDKYHPYVRRMIATLGEPDLLFHEQTDKELIENDIKRMDVDDQAIQTILLGLPEDVYAAVDKNIAANLKFLNNLQPEWKRHVTIVCQTKNLHEADFTQIYDYLKMNQDE